MRSLNTWRWRIIFLAFSAYEGFAIAVAAKRSIPLIVGICVVLCVVRLALEAIRP